jgi:hypothetical protein
LGRSGVLISSILIGILIMLSPIIITGHQYDVSRVMGTLLVAEFIVRTLVMVIGLIIIYDGIKRFFSTIK